MKIANWTRRTAWIPGLVLVASLGAVGCSTSPAGPAGDDTADTSADTPNEAAIPSEPEFDPVVIPAGVIISVQFDDTVSSNTSQPGDRFTATIVDPVDVEGRPAIPSGSTVQGRVIEANPSEKIGGVARLNLDFSSVVLPSGEQVPISAALVAEGKKQNKKDAATIGGATAGGAILGNIIGEDRGDEAKGTQIGTLIGAAVGTAIAATNENDPVSIPAGTVLGLSLNSPVTVNPS